MSTFEVGKSFEDQHGNVWFIYGLDMVATPTPSHHKLAFCQALQMHESFNEGGVQTVWRNKSFAEVFRLQKKS